MINNITRTKDIAFNLKNINERIKSVELQNKTNKENQINSAHQNAKLQDDLKDKNIDIYNTLKKALEEKQEIFKKENKKYMIELDILDQLKNTMESNEIKKKDYLNKLKYIVPITIIAIIVFMVV